MCPRCNWFILSLLCITYRPDINVQWLYTVGCCISLGSKHIDAWCHLDDNIANGSRKFFHYINEMQKIFAWQIYYHLAFLYCWLDIFIRICTVHFSTNFNLPQKSLINRSTCVHHLYQLSTWTKADQNCTGIMSILVITFKSIWKETNHLENSFILCKQEASNSKKNYETKFWEMFLIQKICIMKIHARVVKVLTL